MNLKEIRPCLKVCSKPGHSMMNWRKLLALKTVREWRKTFLTGTESLKNTANSGRPVTVTSWVNVSKVREIINSNDRYAFES